MKQANREQLKEAIGIIEGVSFYVGEAAQQALAIAVEILEEVITKEDSK